LVWKPWLQPGVERIAIANPEHAPYGRAAVAALRKAGVYEQLSRRLVYGENIAQAAQFVASGSAQAGILALSLAGISSDARRQTLGNPRGHASAD